MSITATMNLHKAMKRIQRALRKNPNDIESLLQLAAILGTGKEPKLRQKRQVLHRVLSLEPANHKARGMLFEMDRATIGGNPSRLSLAVILYPSSSSELPEPPLILRYSIVGQSLVYLLVACMVFLSWSVISDVVALMLGAILVIPFWFISAVIEVTESGLTVSRLFGIVRSEIAWGDMREIRPTALGQGIKVISHRGKTVEISARIHGYPFLLDILRHRRPDIFRGTERTQSSDVHQNDPAAASVVAKTVGKI